MSLACINPYPFNDVLLIPTNVLTTFTCRVCGFFSRAETFLDNRTTDTFVLCPSCITLYRLCDLLAVDISRVGNWKNFVDGLGPAATTSSQI